MPLLTFPARSFGSIVTDDFNSDGRPDMVVSSSFNTSGSNIRVFLNETSCGPLFGDVNQDGVVNLLDVAPFVVLLSSGEFQEEADVNQGGAVNTKDVAPFVDLLTGG